MDLALRIALPIYLVAFFLIAFVWRSYLVWKRTGINPYVVGKSDSPIDFVERSYRVPVALVALVVGVFAVFPSVYAYAAPLAWLELPVIRAIGLVLLVASLIWIAAAQIQMGASWRIGIDSANATNLVSTGLFRVSRNPIFFGLRAALLGFFLTLPNAFSLVALALGNILMQTQVRLEEEHLRRSHGEDYETYCRKVRRWI